MKTVLLQKLITHNNVLKVTSLILATIVWYSATSDQKITTSYTIPICFNNNATKRIVEAPEYITVFLQGTRKDLSMIDPSALAAHINIDKLLPGTYDIIIKNHHLLLPPSIILQHYEPAQVTVTVIDVLMNKEIE
jgi:hypothetical protein